MQPLHALVSLRVAQLTGGQCPPTAHIVRVLGERLLALGWLSAAARGVGAGAAVGLDVRAGSLVLSGYVSSDTVSPHPIALMTGTHRHVDEVSCVGVWVGE